MFEVTLFAVSVCQIGQLLGLVMGLRVWVSKVFSLPEFVLYFLVVLFCLFDCVFFFVS